MENGVISIEYAKGANIRWLKTDFDSSKLQKQRALCRQSFEYTKPIDIYMKTIHKTQLIMDNVQRASSHKHFCCFFFPLIFDFSSFRFILYFISASLVTIAVGYW